MASDFVRNLMLEQRKRLVGSLLSGIEQSDWYPELDNQERKQLRERVLSSVGSYHDVVLDVLKAATPDAIVSDDAIRLLQAVHDRTARIERELKKNI